MHHLETVQIDDHSQTAPFRLPVQWVNRPNQHFRGFSGLIASGSVHPGDRLRVLPSGKESRVAPHRERWTAISKKPSPIKR